ncbi:NAD-dependent epimerase/dehydratase family protein [Thalassotalea montiporae]
METILVTGAAGFFGSFICDEFISNGYKVIGVDNLFRGKLENLSEVNDNENFEFVKMDLSENGADIQLHNILKNSNVSRVMHFAAVNGTQHFYDNSVFVFQQNIDITRNVMLSIKDSPVNHVIYASSSEAYGEPLEVPTNESHPVLLNSFADRDSYASSKVIGDFYTRLYAKQYNINYTVLRIFNMYGERMVNTKYGQVIPEFVTRCLQEPEFTIIGDGSHTRSFCYIKDATSLLRKLVECDVTGFINLGNDAEISILELAASIHKKVGREFTPVHLEERPHDHKRRRPDITKLKNELGELDFTPLETGLELVIKYYKALIEQQGEKNGKSS